MSYVGRALKMTRGLNNLPQPPENNDRVHDMVMDDKCLTANQRANTVGIFLKFWDWWNQCCCSMGVMWWNESVLVLMWAAEFWTSYSLWRDLSGRQHHQLPNYFFCQKIRQKDLLKNKASLCRKNIMLTLKLKIGVGATTWWLGLAGTRPCIAWRSNRHHLPVGVGASRSIIDFVVISSDLQLYVLDIQVKRDAELWNDHHLVVSWSRRWQ